MLICLGLNFRLLVIQIHIQAVCIKCSNGNYRLYFQEKTQQKKSTCLLTDRVSICQTFRSIFFLRPLLFPGKGTLLTLAFVHRSKAKELSLSTKTWTLDKTCEKESSMYTSSGLYQRSQQRSALRPQRLTPRNRRAAASACDAATPTADGGTQRWRGAARHPCSRQR